MADKAILPSALPPEEEIERLHKVINVLMKRVEQSMESQGSDYALFQSAVVLEQKVNQRTEELNKALVELGGTNRKLRRSQQALEGAIQRLNDAVENISEGFALFDPEDRLTVCNSSYRQMWGFDDRPLEDLLGSFFSDLVSETTRRGLSLSNNFDWPEARIRQHQEGTGTFEYHFRDGTCVQVRERKTEDGCTVGIYTDVTELKQREEEKHQQELAEKSLLLQSSLDSIQQGVAVFDHNELLVACNQRFTELMELPISIAQGNVPLSYIRDVDENFLALDAKQSERLFSEGKLVNYERTFSAEKVVDVQCSPMPNGGFVATFTDISEQKTNENQVRYIATHDALTGIANRNLFNERFSAMLNEAANLNHSLALLFMDLDDFKDINDTLGHPVGDRLLQAITSRINNIYPMGGIFARLGGDEFAIVMPMKKDSDDPSLLAELVIQTITQPFQIDGNEIHSGVSIGLTCFPRDGRDVDILLRNADLAMYKAKQKVSRRSRYAFYQEEMNQWVQERKEIEHELRHALGAGQLFLQYQPRFNLQQNRVVGMEALVRWRHPTKGLISPATFIPVAEQSGLISQVGNWVIETACRQAVAWQKQGLEDLTLAVNLSPAQFHYGDPIETIERILQQTGLSANNLEIEITENTLMEGVEYSIRSLQALKQKGIRIAIDDFGTGYSSLNYLKRFPVDVVKIDQSFVANIGVDSSDEAIVDTVLSLGHLLNLDVVGEGVETEAQLEYLRAHECDEIQGYFFSRPLSVECFSEFCLQQKELYEESLVTPETSGMKD
ncbi:EAL domain-containing protein [Neptuniibacter sp.]|uniref:putative bifunctional diguanylate cyclase/phosphodiesterase n=1 Tax=Neptuniibacter sp. TaxID=1962643 RepID=UPI00262EC801|nr:EAL domain-containing protein [Neptuniibacter sp.]MCP4598333.1 EAL domain-containing protein [Neptuniibacter sp.]